jgi:hypothetical protein
MGTHRNGWNAVQLAALAAVVSGGCFLSSYTLKDEQAGGAGPGGSGAGDPGAGGGGKGGHGTGGGTTSTSSGTPCTSPSDCPSPAACTLATCDGVACGSMPAPAGVSGTQVPGDCWRILCDGQGNAQAQVDNADHDDGNPCTFDVCTASGPMHSPQWGTCAYGTCDGAGHCVPIACTLPDTCGASNECVKTACSNGICSNTLLPQGTLCNGGLDQCNGAGACVDCTDNGGCDEASMCVTPICVPA